LNQLLERLPSDQRKKIRQVKQPDWIDPMLATLTDNRFSDQNWIFERKLDGERCLTFQSDRKLRLMSRNQEVINNQYPELVRAFHQLNMDEFIVDGEIVAFRGNLTSFSELQDRMHVSDPSETLQKKVKIYYYLFDLLYLDGSDLTQVSQRERKSLLKAFIHYKDPIRYVNHHNCEGEAFFKEACNKGWEGIIAKRADGIYVHSRSKDWLKFKCVLRQELVIGGYTDPHGSRQGFGALLLGYYDDQQLIYAGKVGTGFDDETLHTLKSKLKSLQQDQPAFEQGDVPNQEVHWVKPDLVAQIGFEEWTSDGKLRQPRYLGLRQDKKPSEVVREQPI